ncbi:MAG: radical SAM protein, partial [Deltaproteobacteria bacterium]|nr:radical SAM protein [Deltaproteobacteria bacterium]
LLGLSEEALARTGYEDMSLLSLSTGDYENIVSLMQRIMENCATKHIAVSLPSLRAGTLTPELMRLIKKVRKTGFTIAPEAGTQRLRKFINKKISKEEIIETVQNAFDLGWQVIKLYFMIGLPSESQKDIQGIVDLVKKLRKIKGKGGNFGKINVSVSTFIPKPHTPFQWEPQLSLDEAKQRIRWIRNHLKMPGVRFKWQNPET